jgi:heptaprenyl diphosphate synthase
MALLLAAATALHVVEMWLPSPFPAVPGAKLGLANLITLIMIPAWGFVPALEIAIFRVLLGSLVGGTLFTFGFLLSMTGAVMSAIVMAGLYKLVGKWFSLVGISLAGALTHNVSQLIVASFLVNQFGLFVYLPYLLLFALPTGFFIGLVGKFILPYVPDPTK